MSLNENQNLFIKVEFMSSLECWNQGQLHLLEEKGKHQCPNTQKMAVEYGGIEVMLK